ncbi:MAG: hypothetical protein EBZ46_07820 [Actinobacteria bacterium]|nr:hypothetical protein [Actinomycetota bacterium]
MFGAPSARSKVSSRCADASRATISPRSAATRALTSVISRRFTRSRSESSNDEATFTPRSARNMASSSSSHVA